VSSVPTLKPLLFQSSLYRLIQQTQKCRPNKSSTQGGPHPLATPLRSAPYH